MSSSNSSGAGARLRLLLGRGAVLLRQVLADVLAFGAHLRVQLEGLEAQVDGDLALHALDGTFQGCQPDGAPGAGDVGDEVDVKGLGHGAIVATPAGSPRPRWENPPARTAGSPQPRHGLTTPPTP